MEDTEIRIWAAKTFYKANSNTEANSNTIRRAILARSRKEHEPLQVGDYAYTGAPAMTRWNHPGGEGLLSFVQWRPVKPLKAFFAHQSIGWRMDVHLCGWLRNTSAWK